MSAKMVYHCPYCGSDGCQGSYYSYVISKWTTDFYCDECCNHTTIIHHRVEEEEPDTGVPSSEVGSKAVTPGSCDPQDTPHNSDRPWIKYYSQHDEVYWGRERAIEIAKEKLAEVQTSTGSAINE